MKLPPFYGGPGTPMRRRCTKCKETHEMLGGTNKGRRFVCKFCNEKAAFHTTASTIPKEA